MGKSDQIFSSTKYFHVLTAIIGEERKTELLNVTDEPMYKPSTPLAQKERVFANGDVNISLESILVALWYAYNGLLVDHQKL